MLIGQKVNFTIDFVDKDGNPTLFTGTPVVVIDDPSLGDLVVDTLGISGTVTAKAIGTFTVSATDPAGVVPIDPASEDVTAGPAVKGAVHFGQPV